MPALRLSLLAWLVLAPAARAQILYNVTEIPILPIPFATASQEVEVNNNGQVAGQTAAGQGPAVSQAFRYSPTTGLLDLGTFPGGAMNNSIAGGINDSGQVVGRAFLNTGGLSTLSAIPTASVW
jgi:probable HAF family extracellular repeat protein